MLNDPELRWWKAMAFDWNLKAFWDGICWGCTGSKGFKVEDLNDKQKAHLDSLFGRLSNGEDSISPTLLGNFMKIYYEAYVKAMSESTSGRFVEVEHEGLSLAVCDRRRSFEQFVRLELEALKSQRVKIVRPPESDGTLSYFCNLSKEQDVKEDMLVCRDLRKEFCSKHAKVSSVFTNHNAAEELQRHSSFVLRD